MKASDTSSDAPMVQTLDISMLGMNDIVFRRKGRLVLDHVSLVVRAGTIVGLLGSNGAGKTTLFDIVCGLRQHESGRVTGRALHDRIAYLTQVVTIPDALKLGEMAQLVYGLSGASEVRMATVLESVSHKVVDKFWMLWKRRANSCSYGEKRWFVLMIILSLDADLYILDEPTAGVDPEYRFYIWQVIASVRDNGHSVMFSTHAVNEVERPCDCFYFLHDGAARRFDSTTQFMEMGMANTLEQAFVNYVSN